MRRWYLGLALALALVPAGLTAQQDRDDRGMRMGMRGGMGMMGNPADMVLRMQSQLALTPDQLEKLGKIRDKFDKENAEDLGKARKEMEEARAKYGQPPYSDETRQKMQHERQEAQKKYAKLFDNERKAREETMEVLTPEQRDRLRDTMRQRMGRMAPGTRGDSR